VSRVWSKSGSISALACSMLTPGLRRAKVRIGSPKPPLAVFLVCLVKHIRENYVGRLQSGKLEVPRQHSNHARRLPSTSICRFRILGSRL
jgi:hypothetical protein